MLELSVESRLPRYQIKLGERILEFDPFEFGQKTQALDLSLDPAFLKTSMQGILGITVEDYQLDVFEIGAILADYDQFAKDHLNEPVKKVLGVSLYSDTTTDSAPPKSEDSVQLSE